MRIELFHFSVGIRVDLFFVWGLKSTSVLCAGQKLLGFNFWIEIDLGFIAGIEIDLVLCAC